MSLKANKPLSDFSKKVYELTGKIPAGRVSTYRAIARALKNSRASRAVGNALNKNPYAPKVPCHRVIRSNGETGGFASGTKKKIAMLRKEGVIINNGRLDLQKYLYGFEIKKTRGRRLRAQRVV